MDESVTGNTQQDEWQRARKFITALGDISRSFALSVRGLVNDGDLESGPVRGHLERVFKSPSAVAHLYFAAKAYHPLAVAEDKKIKAIDLLNIFERHELAGLLLTIYTFRRVLSRIEAEEIVKFTNQLQQYVDLGISLGRAIPAIGTRRALMVASLRQLAFGAMSCVDLKGFKRYKVQTKVKGLQFDLVEEHSMWGTTHLHIGTTLLQQFGYGVEASRAYFRGLTENPKKLNEEELAYRVASIWLDSLIAHGTPPEDTLGDDYSVSETHEEDFIEQVGIILEGKGEGGWLSKRKADLGPKNSPNLDFTFKSGASRRKPGAFNSSMLANPAEEGANDGEITDEENSTEDE